MATAGKRPFWPLDPRPEDIEISTIAHALSMQVRWGGHIQPFYSVAEHCVHVALKMPPEHMLWGLLHDAAETWLTDLPAPVKQLCPQYTALESRIMEVVCRKYDLPVDMPEAVHRADMAIRRDECDVLNRNVAIWQAKFGHVGIPPRGLGVSIECWAPDVACENFLAAFKAITKVNELGPGGLRK